jgi:hypothetical protein
LEHLKIKPCIPPQDQAKEGKPTDAEEAFDII